MELSQIRLSSFVSSSFILTQSYTKLSKVMMVTLVGFVLRRGIKAVCGVTPIGSLSPRLLSQSIWVCLFVSKSCLCVLREMERRKKARRGRRIKRAVFRKKMWGLKSEKRNKDIRNQSLCLMFWQSQQLLGCTQLRWRYKLKEDQVCVNVKDTWTAQWEIRVQNTEMEQVMCWQYNSVCWALDYIQLYLLDTFSKYLVQSSGLQLVMWHKSYTTSTQSHIWSTVTCDWLVSTTKFLLPPLCGE